MHPEAKIFPETFLANLEFPLRARFYPLGFPLDLETNSESVMQAAREAWQGFCSRFTEAPVQLCLGAGGHDELPAVREPRVVSQAHIIASIRDPSTFMVCDLRGGFAVGWLSKKAADDRPFVRYRFLHAYAMNMLVHKFLAPVHAAFVAWDGQGVLLCGDSFAGKSTLAYACARSGWTYLGDDAAYLIRSRTDCMAVANPHYLHLREDAPTLFPELKDNAIAVRPNGKIGMEIPTAGLGLTVSLGCPVAHIVFLRRAETGRVHLAPYARPAAMEWCEQYLCFGERHVIAEQKQTLRRLSGAGIWEMRYSGLDDAIACLQKLILGGI